MRAATASPLVLAISLCFQPGCAHRTEPLLVPSGFSYPEMGERVALSGLLPARRVAGKVLDLNGDPVEKAIVELTATNSGERLMARFTDEHGKFDLSKETPGEYSVRVTKPGFAPLLAKIKVSKSGPSGVDLTMRPAT